MTIDNNDLLNSILASLDRVQHINPDDIPNIDLYMDQVTTLMDARLRATLRYPEEDKILTKTMINNYAKNDLLPPPVKKKYSKEHVLLLIFIYYYKNILSISDIQTLLRPLTEKYFNNGKKFNLESIYEEVFTMEENQVQAMKEDVIKKFEMAQETFKDAPEEDAEFLKKYSFICALSFDVYLKKMMIEKMIDDLNSDSKNASEGKNGEDKKAKEK